MVWISKSNIFPSSHVAAALGASLALLHYVPLAGAIFLAITFWIAVAAVVERYHYTIDVVLGALVAQAVYLVWRAEWTPSALFTAPAPHGNDLRIDRVPVRLERMSDHFCLAEAAWRTADI